MLNALVGRRLARISATPGKTRALNAFWIPSAAPPVSRAYYLLDLPGYGYARASKADRAAFGRLVRHAIGRPALAGVVWLLDIRRDPSDDDRAMQDLFAAASTPVLAAVTKSDKLPRGQRPSREGALAAALQLDGDQVIVTSARTGEGILDLREAIAALLEAAPR